MAQKARENFFRNSTIILDHGKEVLTLLLDNELTNRNMTLEDFVNSYQHDIYHLCYNRNLCCLCMNGCLPVTVPNSRVLHPSQLDILFDKSGQKLPGHNPRSWSQHCCSPAKTTISINQLDLTLIRCLLINFGNICPGGTQVRMSVDNLINFRNKLYGHAEQAMIPDQEYGIYRVQIEQCILLIAKFCNSENILKQKLQDASTRPLDETLCYHYQNSLLDDIRRNEDLKREIEILQEESRERSEDLKLQIKNVEFKSQDILKNIGELRSAYEQGNELIYHRLEDKNSHLVIKIEDISSTIYENLASIRTDFQTRQRITELLIKSLVESVCNTMSREMKILSIKDCRLKNLIDHSKSRIESHRNDETFVKTQTLGEGKTILENRHMLVLLDASGTGKTTLSLHLASIYQIDGYLPLILTCRDILQYRDLVPLSEKCIVIVEDLFGRSIVQYDEDLHKNILDFLASFLETSHEIRIIFNIRTGEICEENIVSKHPLFKRKYVVNMKLSDREKIEILLSHMTNNSIVKCQTSIDFDICFEYDLFDGCSLCKDDISELPNGSFQICRDVIYLACMCDTYTGFPECCRIFCNDKHFTLLGAEYFRNTTKSLLDGINQLFADGFENLRSKYKFCLLAYAAINFYIGYDTLNSNFKKDKLMKWLLSVFHHDDFIVRKPILQQALRDMMEHYLTPTTNFNVHYLQPPPGDIGYMVKHQSMAEAVLMSLGNSHPKKILGLQICDINFISSHVRPCTKGSVEDSRYMIVPSDILISKLISILKKEKQSIEILKQIKAGNVKLLGVVTCWDSVKWNSEDEGEDEVNELKQSKTHEKIKNCNSNHSLKDYGNRKNKVSETQNTEDYVKEQLDYHADNTVDGIRLTACDKFCGDENYNDDKEEICSYISDTTVSRHRSTESEKVGNYMRKLLQNTKYHVFVKTFFETLPHSYLQHCQMIQLLDGVTNRGSCLLILDLDGDNMCNIVLKYATVKIFCLLFRPMSSSVAGHKFYKLREHVFVQKLLFFLMKCSKYDNVKEIGNCLYRIGVKEGNHDFAKKFLNDFLHEDKVESSSYKIKYIIDGLCDQGRQSDAITIHHYLTKSNLFRYGSVKVILGICTTMNDSNQNVKYLKVQRDELLDLLKRRFLNYIYYTEELEEGVNFDEQIQEMGKTLYSFGQKIQDSSFMDSLLGNIMEIYHDYLDTYLAFISPYNVHFLAFLFDGLTDDRKRQEEMRILAPLSMKRLEYHMERYAVFRRTWIDALNKDTSLENRENVSRLLQAIHSDILRFPDE